MNKENTLHLYYKEKGILPTFADFKTIDDLSEHEAKRACLFTDKLHLPPQIFKDARLIEFGSDSGENSMVFARWGANVTLVEPNPNAWSHILDYFEKFGLKDKLISLAKVDLQHFVTTEKFQFIDAEGFIYTLQPASSWVQLFDKILEKNGFFIISYMEAYGSFLELILKLIYTRSKQDNPEGPNEIAWKLFHSKWESIPHNRSFNSWVMDVLENPFIRFKYFINPVNLCEQLLKAGFSLYSSWPNYVDSSTLYWHKKVLMPQEDLIKNIEFITRSCLSFTFGKKIFLCSKSQDTIKSINVLLRELLKSVDQLIDKFDVNTFKKSENYINEIEEFLKNEPLLTDSLQDKMQAMQLLESIRKVFRFLLSGDINDLISFCNSDAFFMNSWGMPNHFAVFKKLNSKVQ